MKRALVAVLVVGALLGACRVARADEVDRCISADTEAQKLRQQTKLVEASAAAAVCARPVCPPVVRDECTRWVDELRGRVPSILLDVRDAHGTTLTDVRVSVDGAPWLSRVGDSAAAIDPGAHVLRFEAAGMQPATQSIDLHEGDAARALHIVLTATPAAAPAPAPAVTAPPAATTTSGGAEAPPASHAGPPRWAAYAAFVLAAAGLAVGIVETAVYFDKRNQVNADRAQYVPTTDVCGGGPSAPAAAQDACARSQEASTASTIAWIGYGGAAVAAGAGVLLLVLGHHEDAVVARPVIAPGFAGAALGLRF